MARVATARERRLGLLVLACKTVLGLLDCGAFSKNEEQRRTFFGLDRTFGMMYQQLVCGKRASTRYCPL